MERPRRQRTHPRAAIRCGAERRGRGQASLDFTFDTQAFFGKYRERSQAQGAAYYQAFGVARDDAPGRREASRQNLRFYGAPHVAMLFLPSFGDDVRVASDIGMYAQTFLLALAARGISAVPQTILGYYADTVREVLGISEESNLLFGISFGYADKDATSYSYDVGRAPFTECATFHEIAHGVEQRTGPTCPGP